MTLAQPQIRLVPITPGLHATTHNPRILLGGNHQPTLLRCLDGWPKRWGSPRNFLIQFNHDGESLSRFPRDAFDMAVIQTPAEHADVLIGELLRVARQGLITRRVD
ncbi:class I SAM-dependent methyltransferase [Pseudomonas sp. LRF_L74]|uniref:class I SAM-dependent methyltransferase n=1 Tax=Pseudomonas sp. LRF_L74 TaxID=3369422 RepID=UPI003F62179D